MLFEIYWFVSWCHKNPWRNVETSLSHRQSAQTELVMPKDFHFSKGSGMKNQRKFCARWHKQTHNYTQKQNNRDEEIYLHNVCRLLCSRTCRCIYMTSRCSGRLRRCCSCQAPRRTHPHLEEEGRKVDQVMKWLKCVQAKVWPAFDSLHHIWNKKKKCKEARIDLKNWINKKKSAIIEDGILLRSHIFTIFRAFNLFTFHPGHQWSRFNWLSSWGKYI